ncbi:hydroxylamine reductase [Anoxynatronum buryatiense]|uniref:Hydroxylamine reductase n=1 Tax=Anoxynatronum buryatiense TaxID=489973 RepID=A0AA45WYS0_9CLOT|nr:hydroxylamine reductase [Anoxynatronum buryatiense]SMP68665.1 hydroxylamine reductase [Anoxynatronum buryatiense]
MSMFCYQCQETVNNTGCTKVGVCGKKPDVANIQDLMIHTIKGISLYSSELNKLGHRSEEVDHFVLYGLFATITNANFDKAVFMEKIRQGLALRDSLKQQLAKVAPDVKVPERDETTWFADTEEAMEAKAATVGVLAMEPEDIRSLKQMITYGLKGMAAYTHHANNLKYEDPQVDDFMQETLAKLTDVTLTVDDLVALTLETGRVGVQAMKLLDDANTGSYGHPEITKVNIGVGQNPGILISGHDLKDMEELLEQTKGTGVDVYTHSEMLPANSYPAFKKYDHFVGNYGGSWWHQNVEFEKFNGPILLTSNCLVPPRDSYKDRVYNTNAVGFPDCAFIPDRVNGQPKDFSALIEHAKKCAPPEELETGEIYGGFAHHQVLQLADKVIDAVKSGAIKRFFVMGGCDARQNPRKYYTDFAAALPKDTVILTAGCAKYRYNKLDLGDIGGIPRVLDAGQCNDSYSLVMIALALKDAFGLEDVNELPISYNIAWYEQKAVLVLLALLSLGIKNIHLGPTLPGFLSPNVAQVIVDNFDLAPISSVDEDLQAFMQ